VERTKNEYLWYRADGTQQVVTPQVKKSKFVLSELRKFVGGSIDLMYLGSKHRRFVGTGGHHGFVDEDGCCSACASGGLVRDGWCLVVNGNGLNENLPTNEEASRMWGSRVVGDVLLCRVSAID
jgi:hypothetical protein